MKLPYQQIYQELVRILLKYGFSQERAALCARLFSETSLDGVYSHGINRFPGFIENIKQGRINVEATPEKAETIGLIERWDGRFGPGNLNAFFCMKRAIELAHEYGLGCVALRNTNHWLRGGTYGWQAAEAGCVGICFTNTIGNMPPWGGTECRIGNNPLVIAVPRRAGPIVLDMAMSLYSYGKMTEYRRAQQEMPFDGGFDAEGRLTRDPAKILDSRRPLPMGYWKGSGLSIMLDLLVTILSNGDSVAKIGTLEQKDASEEIGLSQTFLCLDVTHPAHPDLVEQIANDLVNDLHRTRPVTEGETVSYPGERTLRTRQENLAQGIPVDEGIWDTVVNL